MKDTILYLGGFQLPEKNAAAQRVVGIAKGIQNLGYQVVFLNSLKDYSELGVIEKEYFGFKCFEYKRESDIDYLLSAKTALSMIDKVKPYAIIAYNYPAGSLNRIRAYCKKNKIGCFADVTEWYDTAGEKIIKKIVKGFDTCYRMRYVHKKLDGVITISRYLYDYYKYSVNAVLIPPTVDIINEKWNFKAEIRESKVSFVYAGSPGISKERLDKIVQAMRQVENKRNVQLNIVGITKEQFVKIYNWTNDIPKSVYFGGRVDHLKAIEFVKKADWAIILRENTRMVNAGFPMKVVEAISCGTPVLANRFSNIFDYLTVENSICIENIDDVAAYMIEACEKNCTVDNSIFDYRKYLKKMEMLFSGRK